MKHPCKTKNPPAWCTPGAKQPKSQMHPCNRPPASRPAWCNKKRGGLGAIRTYDNGGFYSVSFGEAEVRDFTQHFPASGLHALRTVWAQFDRKNGDLVDLQCNGKGDCHRFDGPALAVLTEEMQCRATANKAKAKAPRDHCRRGR